MASAAEQQRHRKPATPAAIEVSPINPPRYPVLAYRLTEGLGTFWRIRLVLWQIKAAGKSHSKEDSAGQSCAKLVVWLSIKLGEERQHLSTDHGIWP
jgi:hypothetical protein